MEELVLLDRSGLRKFGLTTGAIVAIMFGLALPWLLNHKLPLWPWVIAIPLASLALLAPRALQPVYKGWMKFGAVVGAFNTKILLGVVFYGLITPLGIAMRLLSKDTLIGNEERGDNYRVRCIARPAKHMERPF